MTGYSTLDTRDRINVVILDFGAWRAPRQEISTMEPRPRDFLGALVLVLVLVALVVALVVAALPS
jgi:hypothetical protein